MHGVLGAGEHLFCEWPWAAISRKRGSCRQQLARRMSGLRWGFRHGRILLSGEHATSSQMECGQILTARMHSETIAFGSKTDKASLYFGRQGERRHADT